MLVINKFHWVLLLAGLGSAFTAQAGFSAEGSAGESEALSYHAQHLDRFIADAPMITPELAAAAFAQGQLDEPIAKGLPNQSADAQGEANATRYFAEHRAEFASHSPPITLAQASAALTQGQLLEHGRTAAPREELSDAAK